MSVRKLIIGGALALTVTAASAAEKDTYSSANFWLPYCKAWLTAHADDDAPIREGICVGEVNGLAHASCADIPAGGTFEQEVRVVIRHIDMRPQRMHEPFLDLALEGWWGAKSLCGSANSFR